MKGCAFQTGEILGGCTNMLGTGRARSKGRNRLSVVKSLTLDAGCSRDESPVVADKHKDYSELQNSEKKSKTAHSSEGGLSKKIIKKQLSHNTSLGGDFLDDTTTCSADQLGRRANLKESTIVHDIDSTQHLEEHGIEKGDSSRRHKKRIKKKAGNKQLLHNISRGKESIEGTTSSCFADPLEIQANSEACRVVDDANSAWHLEGHDTEILDSLRRHERRKKKKVDNKQLLHNISLGEESLEGTTSSHFADQLKKQPNSEVRTVVDNANSGQHLEEHDNENLYSWRRHERSKKKKAGSKQLLHNISLGEEFFKGATSHYFSDQIGTQANSEGHTIVHDTQHREEHGSENGDSSRRLRKRTEKIAGNKKLLHISSLGEELLEGSTDSYFADQPKIQANSGGRMVVDDVNSAQHLGEHGTEILDSSGGHQGRKKKACSKQLSRNIIPGEESIGGTTSSYFADRLGAQVYLEGHTIVQDIDSAQHLEEHVLKNVDSSRRHRKRIKKEAGRKGLLHTSRLGKESSKGTPSSYVADELETKMNSEGCMVVDDINSAQYFEEHDTKILESSRRHERRKNKYADRKQLLHNISLGEEFSEGGLSSCFTHLQTQANSEGHIIVRGVNSAQYIEEHDTENGGSSRRHKTLVKKKDGCKQLLHNRSPGEKSLEGTTSLCYADQFDTQANSEGHTIVDDMISAQLLEEHDTENGDSSRRHERRKKEKAGKKSVNLEKLEMENRDSSRRHERTKKENPGKKSMNLEEVDTKNQDSSSRHKRREKEKAGKKSMNLEVLGTENGDSSRSHERTKKEKAGKKPMNLEELDIENGENLRRQERRKKEKAVKKSMNLEELDTENGDNSRRQERSKKDKSGKSSITTNILSNKKGIMLVEQVASTVNQISLPNSADQHQQTDYSQVLNSHAQYISGEASRQQCSNSGPYIGSPLVSRECEPMNNAQEPSVSKSLQNGREISHSPVRSPCMRRSVRQRTDDHPSKFAFFMEPVISDGQQRGEQVWNENQQEFLPHERTLVEACSFNSEGASTIISKDIMHAENSESTPTFVNEDFVSHPSESLPPFPSRTSGDAPWTAFHASDADTDSVVVVTKGTGLVSMLTDFPTKSTTATDTVPQRHKKTKKQKHPEFVAMSGDKRNHNNDASELSSVPSVTETELVKGVCRSMNVVESNGSLNASSENLHCTGISQSIKSTYAVSEVPFSGLQHDLSGCGDTGNNVSCALQLQTSTVDAVCRSASFHDLNSDEGAPGVLCNGAFSSTHPEMSLLPEERDKREQMKHRRRKAKVTEYFEEKMQINGEKRVSRKRKIYEPCIKSSKETQQKTRGINTPNLTPNQKNFNRRRREIVKRAEVWASQAGFLQVTDECESYNVVQENHVVINERQRDEFVKAMVETCRNNPRLRSSFLGSVKAIAHLGLLQLPATDLLAQTSCKEAEDVIKSWDQVSNGSSPLAAAYTTFFKSVDNLHRAGPRILPCLSSLQAPWSCHLNQTGEEILDVQLPN